MNQWIEANEANENEANEEIEVNEAKETETETGIEVKETEIETETEANEANGANEANEETEKEMKEAEAIDWSDRNMGNRRVVENVEVNRVEEIEADSREAIVAIGRRIDQDSVNSLYIFFALFVCLFENKEKTKRKIAEQLN